MGDDTDLLLVEDNPGDVRLVEEAFREISRDAHLHAVRDGMEAMAFLRNRGEYADAPDPDLVLLDLNLPRMGGFDVLERIREDSELKRLPVIVLTSSADTDDVTRSYQLHANAYLTKPTDPGSFISLVRAVESFWLDSVELPPQ